MADFCKECSIEIFGEDFEELANLCDKGQFVHVLCEGCGPIMVNNLGVRWSEKLNKIQEATYFDGGSVEFRHRNFKIDPIHLQKEYENSST